MDRNLLQILACPLCKGELFYDLNHEELLCKFDRLAFPVVDGIPVMIETRARRFSEED